jgi:hypothetical protein
MESNMIFGFKPKDKCIRDFSVKSYKKEAIHKAVE